MIFLIDIFQMSISINVQLLFNSQSFLLYFNI